MISFANSDSTIWDRDNLIISIVEQMVADQPVVLDTRGEGPCAASLGLYDLLDQLCLRFDYKKTNVTLRTCNLVEQHPDYNIVKIPQLVYLNSARNYSIPDRNKDFKNIKHFGHFIGHGNLHRLTMASTLHSRHRDQSLQTYHYCAQDPYHREFVGLEDMLFHGASTDQIDAAMELIKAAPLTQDRIDDYPILNPTTLNITKLYKDFFVEIVNLTYWSGNTFYLDEKIWRPIMMRTPFIVQGPQYFIARMRELGFKTFSDYWDEGYSEDPAPCQTEAMIEIIKSLSQKSTAELEYMYRDMQTVLEHNYNLFRTITASQLASVCQS